MTDDSHIISHLLHQYSNEDIASQLPLTDLWYCEPWLWGWLLGLLIFIVMFLSMKYSHRGSQISRWIFRIYEQRNKLPLLLLTLSVWLSGVIIYSIGFFDSWLLHNADGLGAKFLYGLTLLFRASISSVEMFVSHSDLIEVNAVFHQSWLYMSLFILTHFFAIFLSVGFIISLVSYQWLKKLKLKGWLDNQNIYFFCGENDASTALTKDLLQSSNNKIVYLLENKNNNHVERWSLMNLLGVEHEALSQVELLNNDSIIGFNEDNLDRLINVIKKHKFRRSIPHFSIFMLSPDEQRNFQYLERLCQLDLYQRHSDAVTIYCRAQRNVGNIMPCTTIKNLKIVDTTYLSMISLRHDPLAHPVNYVDIDLDEQGRSLGTVNSKFTSLVIGFNAIGQEAFDFLYEFGAFANSHQSRSEYLSIAIDPHMEALKGDYYAHRPALIHNPNLQLLSANIHSSDFWQQIDSLVQELNYVVVSLGNDAQNRTLAVEVYEYIVKHRGGIPSKFVIYVHQQSRINQLMDQGIRSVYKNIYYFGDTESIFTRQNIIKEEDIQHANAFSQKYNEVLAKYREFDASEQEIINSTAPQANVNPLSPENTVLKKQYKNRREVYQTMANAYHIHTKLFLITNGTNDPHIIQHLASLIRKPDVSDYNGEYWYETPQGERLNYESQLMTNMAIGEHIRWIAVNEMLGYTPNDDLHCCDEIKLRHNCMVSWDGLVDIWNSLYSKQLYREYKQYDYNVIETSLKLSPTNNLQK